MTSASRMRMLVGIATLVVITSIVVGLVALGSPKLQRDRKMDQQRTNDLAQLSQLVGVYWNENTKLPTNLVELAKLPGLRAPLDPQTGATYEYKPTGELTYSVCAGFALDTAVDPPAPNARLAEEWMHGVGHTCFNRNVVKASGDN